MEFKLGRACMTKGIAIGEMVVRERLEDGRDREGAETDGRGADAGVGVNGGGNPGVLGAGTAATAGIAESVSEIEQAVAECRAYLQRLQGGEPADKPTGARVVEAYAEILGDPALAERIAALLSGGCDAKEAVNEAYEEFARLFDAMDDAYMRGRAQDLRDLGQLLASFLGGGPKDLRELIESVATGDYILVTRHIAVPELLSLEKSRLKGLVCAEGNETAHAAIIARGMGLPAVFGDGQAYETLCAGHLSDGIIDGTRGVAILSPDVGTIAAYRRETLDVSRRRRELETLRDLPTKTRDGVSVGLFANVGSVHDARQVVQMNLDGIGLLRTEILFGEQSGILDETLQAQTYRQIAEAVGDLPMVIRAFDIGGDKPLQPGFLDGQAIVEANPFLGLRGWRYLESQPELLDNQFRAILQTGKIHAISLMVPMVSTVEEVVHARERWRAMAMEAGVNPPPFGIMVEVPSVAVAADVFAPHVDFFSIGTNDLTQYTLAVDRTNETVHRLYQQLHPAVLRLVREVVHAGVKHGVDVSVCGELAADPTGALLLVGLGVRKLSVSPMAALEIKYWLSRFTVAQLEEVASRAVSAATERNVTALAAEAFFDTRGGNAS